MAFDLNSYISSFKPKSSLLNIPKQNTFGSFSSAPKPFQVIPNSQSVVPASNPSATSQNSAINTPAAQNYMKTAYSTPPSNRFAEADATMGNINRLMSELQSQGQNTPASGATGTPTKTSSSVSNDPYIKYLTGMFNADELAKTNKNIQDLNKRTSDELLRTRKREEELRKNEIGQLERGQSYQLGEEERLSNRSLADLAIAKGGAQSIYDSMINAGKSVYEATQAAEKAQQEQDFRQQRLGTQGGFSLSEGETRYDAQGNKLAYGGNKTYAPSGGGGGGSGIPGFSGTLSPLAQAVQNGTITIDKIPMAQRAQIAAELATSGIQSGRQQTISSNLDVVNSLLNNPNKNVISGYFQGKLGLGNLDPRAQLALNQYDQLKGILSLENREKLKGTGAISDFEFKVLSDAATALGRNLSDADFNAQLQKIKDVFEGKYALTNALNASGYTPQNASGGVTPSGIKYTVSNE